VEAVPVAPARGGWYRCDADHASEVRIGREALRAGGLSDQDRCAQRPAAGLGEQLGAMLEHEVAQLALERLGLAREGGNLLGLLARDADSRSLRQSAQPAGDPGELTGVVELARWDRGLKGGVEDHEIPAQPMDETDALSHQRVTVVAHQPDLHRLLIEEHDREPLDPLA
jgi:hypothetical protein